MQAQPVLPRPISSAQFGFLLKPSNEFLYLKTFVLEGHILASFQASPLLGRPAARTACARKAWFPQVCEFLRPGEFLKGVALTQESQRTQSVPKGLLLAGPWVSLRALGCPC